MGIAIRADGVVRPIVATIVLLIVVVAIATAAQLSGLTILGIVLWLLCLGIAGAGAFLAINGRPIVGAGAIIVAIAILLAFFWLPQPSPIVWTLLFFVGAGLIAYGSSEDSLALAAWPIAIVRVGLGWSFVDNAQDHFRSNWLPGGGGYLQVAAGTAKRASSYFLDPPYQSFLGSVVVPNGDRWAGLTICGELVFGAMLAVGLFSSVAAAGGMWQSLNYVLMKGFVSHAAYTDKVWFFAELLCLLTAAGLSYGLDASLRRSVPPWVASWFMGAQTADAEPAMTGQRTPRFA